MIDNESEPGSWKEYLSMTEAMKVKPVAQKRPSVLIATPMYGGMCTGNYVQGLLMTMGKAREAGVNVAWCQIMNESLITRARNELVRVFLESDHDYLMFIDADIGFPGDAILRLMAADKDVACGIYPKKEVNWESVERAAQSSQHDLADHAGAFVFNMVDAGVETDEHGFFEVRHGGTGFMLINRGVFEFLAPYVPTYRVATFRDPATGNYSKPLTYEFFATSIDKSGALLSEDYHFCELVREHGGSIWATPFIRLQHVGTHVFDGDILKSGGNLK